MPLITVGPQVLDQFVVIAISLDEYVRKYSTEMSSPQDYDQQLVAWQEFVDHQKILPDVNHLVADSWRRCRLRLSPFKDTPLKYLSSDHLLATQVAGFDLVMTLFSSVVEECLLWLGQEKRVYLGFQDPAMARVTNEEIIQVFRQLCYDISK